MVPEDVTRFGAELAEELAKVLGDGVVGVYFVGSIALGGYVAGESDIDVIAVSRQRVADGLKPFIAEVVVDQAAACPTRGLEFTLYRQSVVARVPRGADFEVNANGGPRMERAVHLNPHAEPAFWYVIDRAIAHRYGVAVGGPAAASVFADVPIDMLLGSMRASMRWHREHERATLYSVLNACRAWRFAAEGVLGSKLEGAAWARPRWHAPEIIDAAVALRYGTFADLAASKVDQFLQYVETMICDALADRF